MSNLAVQLWPEPLRLLAFTSLSSTYMGIGTASLNAARVYWVQNLTDVDVTFSMDGTTDHFILPGDGFLLLDSSSNKTLTGGACAIPAGTRTYAKTLGTPSEGYVSVTIFYGKNG
jgi:hypothetical protein